MPPDGATKRSPERPSPGYRIRVFDADRTDRELTFADALGTELSERQLLWVDAVAPMDEADAASLVERLDLRPATRVALQEIASQPPVVLYGSYFTVTVATIYPANDREEVRWLQIVAGRRLTSHRELFASLRRAEFAMIAEGDVAAPFTTVAEQFERAIATVENGGELLLGSFDVYMTRTAQRTNEIVKVLTIVSVFLLPGTVIAGLMGINLKAPYSNDDPRMFWITVPLIAGIAVATFVALRLRRWL